MKILCSALNLHGHFILTMSDRLESEDPSARCAFLNASAHVQDMVCAHDRVGGGAPPERAAARSGAGRRGARAILHGLVRQRDAHRLRHRARDDLLRAAVLPRQAGRADWARPAGMQRLAPWCIDTACEHHTGMSFALYLHAALGDVHEFLQAYCSCSAVSWRWLQWLTRRPATGLAAPVSCS